MKAHALVAGRSVGNDSARLAARGQGATRLDLQLQLESGARQRLPLRLGAPTRDPGRMLRLLRDRVDTLKLAGPAVALTLSFPDAAPFTGNQLDLRDPRRTSEALSAITARLQDTLGGRSVLTARSVAQHRPEAAWRPVPFSPPVPSGAAAAAVESGFTHMYNSISPRCKRDRGNPVGAPEHEIPMVFLGNAPGDNEESEKFGKCWTHVL